MTVSQTLRSSVGQKILMAVSGAMLSLFLLVHGIGNSMTFFGSETFNAYAAKLHALGLLIPMTELCLLAVFVLHIFFGLILFLQNNQARPVRYQVEKSSGGRTLGSRTMPYTGVVILIFLVVHLVNFHFADHSIPLSDIVRNVLHQPLYALFYISAMSVLALHISHGFWSLFQTLGINHPKYNAAIRSGTLGAAIVLAAIFIVIPLCALLLKDFLP